MSAEDLTITANNSTTTTSATATATATPTVHQLNTNHSSTTATLPQYSVAAPQIVGTSKYTQLLSVIEELSKDIRPTYTGNKICAERLKRSIIHARILVRECILETDRNARH